MGNEYKYKFANVILAAGAGTRMRSNLPKVMHCLAGQPMVCHVIDAVKPLKPEKTVVVIAPSMDSVREAAKHVAPDCQFAIQSEQKGTGDAVRAALDTMKGYNGIVLVLYGDTPMIRTETLYSLLSQHAEKQATISLLGMRPNPPTGYGRLVMKEEPLVERIVECKDASAAEKLIPWVWAGVMAFDAAFLRQALAELAPSKATGEYYLTSLIEMATARKLKTVMMEVSVEEAMGINDRAQLAEAERCMQSRLRAKAMKEGATLIDPETVYLSSDTVLGKDIVIHPHVVFGKGVSVADNVEIRSFSHIEGAKIMSHAVIGPFARLRPGSVIGKRAHVGNFVELKKTTLGEDAKVNHLSYVGDTQVGQGANIGAGTITCNYDGANKYDTVIGDGAFIGSNSSLVAPVTIGAGAIVGAGSVITEDVGADELAVARAPQVNKAGTAKNIRKRQKKA